MNRKEIVIWYEHIPRDENEEVDLLNKLSMEELEQLQNEVYIQQICIPTFKKSASIMQIDEQQSWISLYIEYLKAGKFPEDKMKAQKITAKTANYHVVK